MVPGDDEEDALTSRLLDELNSGHEHNDKFVAVLFMGCREEELSRVAWVIHNAFLDLRRRRTPDPTTEIRDLVAANLAAKPAKP